MPSLHSSIRAGAVAAACAGAALSAVAAQQPPAPGPAASNFTIFVRSVPIGSEEIAVERTAEGWTIVSSGRLGAPLDIVARRVAVRYTSDWKPLELTVDATLRGQQQTLHTTVAGTVATTQTSTGAPPASQPTTKTDTIDPTAVLLPNPFFGPYEALAARLKGAAAGSTIAAYVVPQTSVTIRVGDSTEEDIQTPGALIHARRTHVNMIAPAAPPLDVDVWSDETGRLLRVSVPAQNLEVVREDVASVAARRVTVSRPNDEQVHIPANGFSLAGTISRPLDATGKPLPAVVLVGGSGPTDRDETAYGIPIFGQLAGAIADAGFAVLRYDKRGVGQSGGRAESAALADFADDVRAVVQFLDDRKDIDTKHLALVGHSEGGSVAMLAAAKDKHVTSLVLVDAMGVAGTELNMDQVRHALDRSSKTDAEKQATIALQEKIQHAVLTGSGWEAVPPQIRKQADNAWFQSLLAFDPAKAMSDVRQPILIVQSGLDTQVPPSNADRLEALARARKNAPPVEVAKIPGVNHLLVPATTGEADEYPRLADKHISPAVSTAIVTWLKKTLSTR